MYDKITKYVAILSFSFFLCIPILLLLYLVVGKFISTTVLFIFSFTISLLIVQHDTQFIKSTS